MKYKEIKYFVKLYYLLRHSNRSMFYLFVKGLFMRPFKLLLCLLLIFFLGGTAYSLNNFWYNGYAIDGTGQVLPSTSVNVRVTIYTGAAQEYQETHNGVTTDQFGIFSVEVGTGGSQSGSLAGITTYSNTRIHVETQVGAGAWVIGLVSSLTSSMVNQSVNLAIGSVPVYTDGISIIGDGTSGDKIRLNSIITTNNTAVFDAGGASSVYNYTGNNANLTVTNATAGRVIWVMKTAGTGNLSIAGKNIGTGNAGSFIYSGSAWIALY